MRDAAPSAGGPPARAEVALPLPLEDRYGSPERARRYAGRRHGHPVVRLFDRVEHALCHRALAALGPLDGILDCPAGAGRLWPTLGRHARTLHAADASAAMLREAARRGDAVAPATAVVAQAHRLPYPTGAVDLVFSHRFLHHLHDREERVAALREMSRVARRHVAFSLFLTGNWKSHRHKQKLARRGCPARGRVYLPRAAVESEIADAGLTLARVHYKLRGYSPLAVFAARVPGGARG